ncbi:GAF domain-containing protein [Gloeocapsopsis dulcis]|uniref:histidine kinase n=1 Tax=Gloeocapsopsis dulcis AAB1 = 1H9 TaxID=1433147 RepID=A0A6N8FXF3_9CHRO|nr:GAF domain-containing protein [Gloeocapsopsis dulcis]MUL37641.1 adenylate cyclase [Gloeocapsopsis dulcis AAB1 = 1H9]WNN89225.1 GAF domain-containing protein [Gloeocapsopsis dulcis]
MELIKHNKPKILILDDKSELEVVCCVLKQDYEVLIANSESAVLEILTKDVAVLISDRQIPLSTQAGLSATKYPALLWLILTETADTPDLTKAVSTGKVFKCLPKSCSLEALKTAVNQAVDLHNILKLRTQELCSTLHRQSRLNTITNTIRSALNSRQILQTIVDTVGQMLDVSCCILRPFQDNRVVEESFIYQKAKNQASGVIHDWVLVQTVWEARELQIIDDVTSDVRMQNAIAYQQANIASSLIVPLCQQELMAVMAIHQCDRPRQWQDDEIELVTLVADQAALALSQARAYDRISALAQREALINKITTAIRSSLDPQDIFAAITQQLGQALHVDGCALSLWTEEDEFVQCVGLYNRTETESFLSPQQLPQSRSPIAGNPVLQLLLKTQQPVVINDLNQQPEMRGLDLPLSSPAARALLVVPLLADNTSIGSITLRSFYKPRHWQIEEIELAQAVAAQAAIAVQQSRLYQKSCALADRLMELDRQKTHFFQNISHEFRTPLTLMLAPLESAVNQQQDLPVEQAAIALRNSRRLLRLVNQLLDLQRLDAGRMQPSFRPCDLLEFVSQIVESFRPYCEKKELELITEFNPCPLVYLDTEKFDKVIYNLLSNAMKFTPPGGKIKIRVETAGDHCLIQVEDTGIGIAKEQIPHLFKRFHQAEAAVNRSYEGSGLGLALAKELIELHSGQISVESIRKQGTTFTVWLPIGKGHLPLDQILEVPTQVQLRSAAVELADLEIAEADTDNDGIKLAERMLVPNSLVPSQQLSASILVVDDNLDLRTYVSTILTQQGGYQVYTARNGMEGLHLAYSILPDLIVTDLMMPQLSGLEMIWQIRNDKKLKGIPIVLLTAKTDEETRITGTEHGADGYLAKPFNDRELLAEVRNLLALKENERRVVELNTYLTESVLKRFLPPEMVKKAAMGNLALDLRPEPRLITILFSDIVGFTQLANTLRSRRVAELLNEYLETMIRAVFDNGGTVDKFMGDALLALFGAPEEMMPNEQVRHAIATARAMNHSLHQLNKRWYNQNILGKNQSHLIQFRCGIHQGTAVVGMFGSAERADYTAIGPSVNIAARLQQAATPGQILVSAAVADYLDDNEIIKYSPLKLKGVDETVLTFSVRPKPSQN